MAVMTNCNRCGKTLTNPKSIDRGYGPVCWRKINSPYQRKISFDEMIKKGYVPLEDVFGA